jgi:hypothetical protein
MRSAEKRQKFREPFRMRVEAKLGKTWEYRGVLGILFDKAMRKFATDKAGVVPDKPGTRAVEPARHTHLSPIS